MGFIDKKISELVPLAAPAVNDLLAIVDVSVAGFEMKQITVGGLVTGGIVAPADAQYVTLALHAGLPNERILMGTVNQVIITDGGAGGLVTLSTPQNIHITAEPTFAGLNIIKNSYPIITLDASGATTTYPLIDFKSDRPNDMNATGSLRFYNNGATPVVQLLITRGSSDVKGDLDFYTSADHQLKLDEDGDLRFRVGNNIILFSDAEITETGRWDGATGNITTSGTVDGVDLAGAAGAQFVTMVASGFLANERILTGTVNQITVTDGGAGGNVTISLPSDINLTGASSIGTTAGDLTIDPAVDININSVTNYDWAMGNSAQDPRVRAPDDWVQVEIADAVYYLPAYVA